MRHHLAKIDAVLIQAVIAGALSFAHLHDLAEAAGQGGWKAWAYPISVDLLLVAAWRRLRSGHSAASGWCWFLTALAASLGANIATAGLLDLSDVPDWLRILVAGWPAVAFLGGTLLVHQPKTAPLTAEPEPEPAPGPEPDVRPSPDAVPAALLDHARKVATAHQDRTGQPIDGATLRARLGVPQALADRIATQLT
ncbi:DUF2637 domain-containing protein [Streptomyces sp. NPDC059076]|uniref:DUF2637 domain-containing protein n=1 Tax=unclassified Streptomyces TaxID=2593676 RepID=UPI0036CABFDF